MARQLAHLLLLLICLATSLALALSARVDTNLLIEEEEEEEALSPSLFVFGASMVDPGTNAVAMPFRSKSEFNPYGSDYFDKPVGRWSNGRTFMDVLTQSLGIGLLDPFIKSLASNFSHGVNFASSGSTAQNTSSTITNSGGLFSLLVQVEQFREYRNFIISQYQVSKNSKKREQFSNSIYFFETGHNDYIQAGIDSDHLQVVQLVIASMRQAFEVLYTLGARNFIVMNVTPLGCTPAFLAGTTTMKKDAINCTIAWNDFVSMHNQKLGELLDDLRAEYPMAEWILFDAYNVFLDGYRNPSKYGVKYPLQACCGGGGPYNYIEGVVCGDSAKFINGSQVEAKKCKDPSLHIIWDSIHPTESFSKYIAKGVLSNTHLIPKFNISLRFKNVSSN